MRSRFTLQTRLDYYKREELTKIVLRSCKLSIVRSIKKEQKNLPEGERNSCIANNLIHFTRDYAEERADGKITRAIACNALDLLAIDSHGLDEMDKRILSTMAKNYQADLSDCTIAVGVGEEEHTLEEVHEPFSFRRDIGQANGPRSRSYFKGWKFLFQGWSIIPFRPDGTHVRLSFFKKGKRCLNDEA